MNRPVGGYWAVRVKTRSPRTTIVAGLAALLLLAGCEPAELTREVRALGADLALVESCHVYDECDVFTSTYPVVLAVEYDRRAFTAGCTASSRPANLSIILRDRDVSPRGSRGAVHEHC